MTPTRRSRFRTWARRVLVAFGGWVVFAGLVSFLVPNVPVGATRTGAADGMVVGAVHMHTSASDGSGTVDDLVDAALHHGLDFIVVSDHNTREPTTYEYRRGVLVVHGEEVTSISGHVMLLDVDTVRISEADSVDRYWGLAYHREFGDAGVRIAAHPNGRRYWRDRTAATIDGMELWNADSEWRNDTAGDWLEALTLLPFRPALGMMALVDRPDRNLAFLDSAAVGRTLTTTCAVDAHARIDITDDWLIAFPSYRMTLGLVHQHVVLDRPLTGDADVDGPMLVSSILHGGGHCSIGGLADDSAVRIREEGGVLSVRLPEDIRRARIRVFRNGDVIVEEEGLALDVPATEPGMYRVEVDVRARLVRSRWFPWILSAPVWVGPSPDDPPEWLLGTFEDDYGNRYTISRDTWVQEPDVVYEVERWIGSQAFVLARNGSGNASDAGLWTRIDWVDLRTREDAAASPAGTESEWPWGFCISTWNAATLADARATETADRAEPRTGCGGFPFSRMRRIE